ncbi:MAG: tetratricopeptide repeat protein, partial [Planctomycetia bacterium]|nr:tetratricopeptide repeat protein [Planctomycetia bacterium]
MNAPRYLTLLWPGMPWLWLRGSLAGLVLALAFGLAIDVAVLTTWVWTELVDVRISLALWASTAAVWLIATGSALSAFPPPLRTGRDEATDALFVKARDAYLARDWLAAETRLRTLLELSPTDGEAQLLLGTLLRRVGRLEEARRALQTLSRSDSGASWSTTIAREIARIATAAGAADEPPDGEGDRGPAAVLPLQTADERPGERDLAA